jgi:hypothetical protein
LTVEVPLIAVAPVAAISSASVLVDWLVATAATTPALAVAIELTVTVKGVLSSSVNVTVAELPAEIFANVTAKMIVLALAATATFAVATVEVVNPIDFVAAVPVNSKLVSVDPLTVAV